MQHARLQSVAPVAAKTSLGRNLLLALVTSLALIVAIGTLSVGTGTAPSPLHGPDNVEWHGNVAVTR